MHLKTFYYDLDEVIPLSLTLRDTTEHYIEAIIDHDMNVTTIVSMWNDEREAQATWESHSTVCHFFKSVLDAKFEMAKYSYIISIKFYISALLTFWKRNVSTPPDFEERE